MNYISVLPLGQEQLLYFSKAWGRVFRPRMHQLVLALVVLSLSSVAFLVLGQGRSHKMLIVKIKKL